MEYLSFNHAIFFSSSILIMLALSMLFVFMGAKIVVLSANNINFEKVTRFNNLIYIN